MTGHIFYEKIKTNLECHLSQSLLGTLRVNILGKYANDKPLNITEQNYTNSESVNPQHLSC